MKKNIKKYIWPYMPENIRKVIRKYYSLLLIKNFKESNEPDIKVVRRLISIGDGVVDIGANIGVYTSVLSTLVGISGKVISVEPIPSTFEVLKFIVKRLRFSNVELINCAVSDENKDVHMEIPGYRSESENYYEAHIVDGPGEPRLNWVAIKGMKLDSLLGDKTRIITFVKCDVEGNELRVIKGAREIIARFAPAWLIEISSDPDAPRTTAYELFILLQNSGYKAYRFDGQFLNERQVGDKAINYFFLTETHINFVRDLFKKKVL